MRKTAYILNYLDAASPIIKSHKKAEVSDNIGKRTLQFAEAENQRNEDSECDGNWHQHATRVLGGIRVGDLRSAIRRRLFGSDIDADSYSYYSYSYS